MIGNCLNLPSDQRVEGTLVTSVMAVEAGCAFVRVHDVEANRRAIMMAEAVKNA
jgi:dihydropteroate synthase